MSTKSVHKKFPQKVFTKSVHKNCPQKAEVERKVSGRGAEGERQGRGRWRQVTLLTPSLCRVGCCYSQLFLRSILIIDIATYRLNQPRGQCSENNIKCITG